MTATEDRVRAYLRALADEADQSQGPGAPNVELASTRPRTGKTFWVPLGVAAAVLVLAGASGIHWGLSASSVHPTPQVLASQTPTPDVVSNEDEQAVRSFIDGLRAEGADVHPTADWSNGVLVLAAADPLAPSLAGLEGDIMGGLRVTIIQAKVSPSAYDHAIAVIGRSVFPDSDRIDSFNYPADGSYVVVRVQQLDAMGPDQQAALASNLEGIADVPVHLTDAIPTWSLVGEGR